MTEPTMKDLRAQAKAAGINSFGMKKVDLIAALAVPVPEVGDPVVGLQPNPRADRPTDREETGRQARIPLDLTHQVAPVMPASARDERIAFAWKFDLNIFSAAAHASISGFGINNSSFTVKAFVDGNKVS